MPKNAFTLYNASAGSGKTYTLVKEYLKIILLSKKDDAYRNILAITFTNKAVNEMKTRVVDSLYAFTQENPTDKVFHLMQDISIETGLSIVEIHQKAKSIIKNLIHNYAAFDISTIDKFTHRVIRTFAHDLNLPITFEVSLDTDDLLKESVDSLIAEAGNDEILTKLLVNFVMEKTDDDKSWDISREIINTGKLLLNENNREELIPVDSKRIEDFILLKTKIENEKDNLEQQNINLATQLLGFINQKGIDLKSFKGSYFPKHIQSIAENRFNQNLKKYFNPEDIVINNNVKDKEIIEDNIPYFLAQMSLIYQNFEKINLYTAFLKNITPISLLNTLNKKLKEIQEERNILSIAEFNKLIFEQIQNQPAPFIYERMGEKYRHFFIDEFQDTSEMQWKNLIPLIDNALSGQSDDGTKGSLMIVGDPKQSIYRWRGGKAEQFIDLSNDANPFSNPDKKIENLDTNYRSYSQIIEFNNDFFKFLSQYFENKEYKKLFEEQSHQKTNSKKGGYINIHFLPKIDKKDYADEEKIEPETIFIETTHDKVVEAVNKGFQYRDIVILVRKNEEGSAIANFLTEKGIPIVSSESLLLSASSEVQFIISFLNYLNNQKNQEAKAFFLYYLSRKQNNYSTHDFINNGIQQKNETDLENYLTEFGYTISFKNIRKKSLFEIVEWLIETFISTENQNAYTQYFLDLVLENETRKQSGIDEFLSYWETNSNKLSIASPEGIDAVRIMTIHKSKGLEFPVVIFPFVKKNFSYAPKDNMWITAEESFFELPKILVGKSSKIVNYGEIPAQEYLNKKEEELLDEINVLYVALTRAEEQLYIISQHETKAKTSNKYPNAQSTFLIEFLENRNEYNPEKSIYEFGNSIRVSENNHQSKSTKNIPTIDKKLPFRNIKIAQKEGLMWNTKQQRAIEYGNIIHEILASITTKQTIDIALEKAIENGLIQILQKDETKKTIEKIVLNDELSSFFDADYSILNEQIIIQNEGTIVKPDRMVLKNENEIYLLDYKTGTHQAKYETQLNNYKEAIEKMGYKVTKKTLVYISDTIEVVNL